VIIGAALRGYRLGDVPGSHIGDESWYAQAARTIAGFPVSPSHLRTPIHAFIDPNTEHPPLAKLIMAASLRIFGNREAALRAPSVLLGTLSIWLVYSLVLRLKGTRTQALVAAFVLTFENLWMVHGRIATLDIYFAVFILLGMWLWVSSYLEVAAIAFGLATLCKTNAVVGIAIMLFYEALQQRSRWMSPSWPALLRRGWVVAIYLGFFLTGLGALDGFVTEFSGPFAHLQFMGHFHSGLKSTEAAGTHSLPPQWWLNQGTFTYYSMKTTVHGVVTKQLLFMAVMNGYVVFLAPLALAYAFHKVWRGTSPLAAFVIASFLGNFAPLLLAWIVFSRTSYIYYMVPLIPCFACAFALAADSVPKAVRWGFLFAVLFAAAYQYPLRV
jgi:predicted membrane-bound dolichyl-phosphate-mannose-protein mannosyltransferase